ncbi:FAD/NAD(P)-binding domain-containing protein [Lophiostoma macrostomum CBS 122681]|uniref:FAD/NAD(P)-binding domain-containing protein n=1 Tax=Lophiostoma macrostomum CBS 122681 TaxID=1314788 RepID=A0A6A6TQI8_9PLEO|nr:FAD/NAD(P)-binding domain-containing protein [Lophiostoma macrostomum CBS 122681]
MYHPRKLRMVTIGGGISAMNLAHMLMHEKKMDDVVEHVIYEANEVLGGTWWVNKYPGVACDVPAHIYTFPFEPNPDWSAFYASGSEIHDYFMRTVKKYNLDRDVKLSHRIVGATFDEYEGIWNLRVEHDGRVFDDWCNILISATGFLSSWSWPDIPGLEDFKGLKAHSAAWDTSYDYSNKRIAMVGNGSSAIQIMPELAKIEGTEIVNFVRSPTWITPGLGSAVIDGQTNKVYSEEEKREFREKPEKLKAYRKAIQHGSNEAFAMFEKDSDAQKAAFNATSKMMLDRLGGNTELAAKLTPTWEVGCRRVTPGPSYLESFLRPNVSLTTSPISHITRTGITTHDATHHPFDAIICATGFNVSHRPAFPLVGLNGTSLSAQWSEEPLAYLSICAPNFPNYFMFGGPNAPVGHGSLMAALGWTAEYICRWVRKMCEEDVKWVCVTERATQELNAYADEVMQGLVWSGGCRSWYKKGRVEGRVTAVWGGSAVGFKEVTDVLRPEDFRIEYRTKNRFRWMGSGKTKIEGEPGADLAFYLKK